jgi:hypothetical protein
MVQPTLCVDIRVDGLSDETLEKIRDLVASVEVDGDELKVIVRDEDQVKMLARMIMDSGAELRQFTPRRQQLEEVFLQSIEESS